MGDLSRARDAVHDAKDETAREVALDLLLEAYKAHLAVVASEAVDDVVRKLEGVSNDGTKVALEWVRETVERALR